MSTSYLSPHIHWMVYSIDLEDMCSSWVWICCRCSGLITWCISRRFRRRWGWWIGRFTSWSSGGGFSWMCVSAGLGWWLCCHGFIALWPSVGIACRRRPLASRTRAQIARCPSCPCESRSPGAGRASPKTQMCHSRLGIGTIFYGKTLQVLRVFCLITCKNILSFLNPHQYIFLRFMPFSFVYFCM